MHHIQTSATPIQLDVRNYACMCENCQLGSYQDCESKNILGEHILPNNMKFKQKAWNDESSDDESDNEEMEEDEEECDISDAVHMIGANDDFNPNFLFVANQELFESEEGKKDVYGHVFQPVDFCHNWKFPWKNLRWSILQRRRQRSNYSFFLCWWNCPNSNIVC